MLSSLEREVQDHSATYYAVRYAGYGECYHRWLLEKLMEGMKREWRILDVGCGTGFLSKCYWPKNYSITGIDLSDGMLRENPWPEQYHMDVCQMSFDSATFDGIICRSLLHHLPDHLRGLAEMHRVLKPHGKVAFLETNKSLLATVVRKFTQHGDRFSKYHHSFRDAELLRDVRKWFEIDVVEYLGFLAYPLWGFPDIIPLYKVIPCKRILYPVTMWIDRQLSRMPCLKRLSWALLIRAHKA